MTIVCETSHNVRIDENKPTESNETNLSSFNYQKTEWDILKASLKDVNWKELLDSCENSEEKMFLFLIMVNQIVNEHCIKFKQPKGKSKKNIPRDRRKLLRKKKKFRNSLKKRGITKNKITIIENEIINIDKQLLDSHRNERINEEMHAIDNIKENPKHFFTYAKKHIKTKSTIGPFKIEEKLITSFEEISEKLSDQYTSSFSKPDSDYSIDDPKMFFTEDESSNHTFLDNFSFTKEMIVLYI